MTEALRRRADIAWAAARLACPGFIADIPPSAATIEPVTHAAASEARNTTIDATSSGRPARPSGYAGNSVGSGSGSAVTQPGLMALTRILRGPSSTARCFVSASIAPLVDPYSDCPGRPPCACTDEKRTTDPPVRPRWGRAAWTSHAAAATLTA